MFSFNYKHRKALAMYCFCAWNYNGMNDPLYKYLCIISNRFPGISLDVLSFLPERDKEYVDSWLKRYENHYNKE